MKEEELRKSATCASCRKPFGACGAPTFFRVKIDQHIINLGALHRQAGLEMMMGHPALAQVFSPNEDMSKVARTFEMTLCSDCCTANPMMLMEDV